MHRDTFFSCPRCACGLDASGTRLACGQCHGVLIPEREFLDQVSGEQARALLAPDARSNGGLTQFVHDVGPVLDNPTALSCPRCTTTMTHHELFAVPLDRCRAHGVWVDGQQGLRTILATAVAGVAIK